MSIESHKLAVAIEGLKQITYAGPLKAVLIATNILAAIQALDAPIYNVSVEEARLMLTKLEERNDE